MAEVSTPALRRAVSEFSHEAVHFSEMLSSGAIAAGSPHNEPLVKRREFDDGLIYQIVGADPAVMAEAARRLADGGCGGIDINMGCPNHELVKRGAGARLLSDPARARTVVRECRASVRVPLSVKMRAGWDSVEAGPLVDFALMLQDEGVDFITLHPRSAKMNFTRTADWSLVTLLKERLSVPVVGNGDIADANDAFSRLARYGCDGIMIGRAAAREPWIFRLAEDLLRGGVAALDVDIACVFDRVLGGVLEFLPPHLHRSRGHRAAFYLSKNVRFSHELFKSVRRFEDIPSMRGTVAAYFARNPGEARRSYVIEGGVPGVRGAGHGIDSG